MNVSKSSVVPFRSEQEIVALIEENERLVESIAARDSFLAVAAHELRNPMTPILGRVTLLRRSVARGASSNADIVEALERIEKLVVHFIKRATTLLDVARADVDRLPVDIGPVDLMPLLHEIADTYRPSALHAGASIGVGSQNEPTVVVGADRLALEQVLENLVTNAIKYGAGSPIHLDARVDREAGVARIGVRDEGPGIAVEKQPRIFERYERAVRPEGSIGGFGVGLWIVRQLCNSMGGAVELTSSPGTGTLFTVTLPVINAKDGS